MSLKKIWPKLLLLLATLIWGSSFFILKNTLDSLPPFRILAIRFTIAALLLFVLFYKRFHDGFNKTYLLHGGIIGFFLFAAYALQTYGLAETTPGKNAFLTTVYCILVPILGFLFEKRVPRLHHLLSALICVCGIGLIALDSSLTMHRGDILTLLSGLGFALHILAINRFGADADPILLTVLQFAFCAVFCWCSTLLFETVPSGNLQSAVWPLLYLSVFCTAAALLCQNIGQKYNDPTSSSIILSLEAVFGVVFSILLYHETITLRLFCGFALVFIAVLLSEIGLPLRKKNTSKEKPGSV